MADLSKVQPTWSMVAAAGILAGTLGYFLGMGSGLFANAELAKERAAKDKDSDIEDSEDEDDGVKGPGDCQEECKMVFLS